MLEKKEKYNVAIVGATGLIGKTLLSLLEKSQVPINNLYLFASSKSVGKKLKFRDQTISVLKLTNEHYKLFDIVFFTVPAEISSKYIPRMIENDLLIIDNSAYYRLFSEVPLVVPFVNDQNLTSYRLIANPNCSTIQAVSALKIIDELFKLKEVNYATYQAVSGSGYKGVIDLEKKTKKFYPYNVSETCIPAIGKPACNNFTEEEMKMINETKKILTRPKLKISATCVRVPVLVGHGIVTDVRTKKKIDLELLKKQLVSNPRLIVKDDLPTDNYPTSIDTYNNDSIYLGRIRLIDDHHLVFYSTSNNLLTGAAANSLFICEKYLAELNKRNAN